MYGKGNIILGLTVEETGKGYLLRSPDLNDFGIYMETTSVGDALKLIQPALNLYMAMQDIAIQNVFIVMDDQKSALPEEEILNPKLWYRMVLVPQRSPKPGFSTPGPN